LKKKILKCHLINIALVLNTISKKKSTILDSNLDHVHLTFFTNSI